MLQNKIWNTKYKENNDSTLPLQDIILQKKWNLWINYNLENIYMYFSTVIQIAFIICRCKEWFNINTVTVTKYKIM